MTLGNVNNLSLQRVVRVLRGVIHFVPYFGRGVIYFVSGNEGEASMFSHFYQNRKTDVHPTNKISYNE